MTFATPWGLLALLGVPVVLWLHRLRRRLRERRVAGLFLFAPEATAEAAGRTLAPIQRTASLVLELLGAVLLALLLAGPRFSADAPPPHLVLVLDDGASMGAVVDGASPAARARSFGGERVRALGPAGVATVLATGRPPEGLAGPRASPAEALAALERWVPLRAAHDARPALDLALELAGPEDVVLFLTDEADPAVPDGVEVAAFGRAAPNVALSSARRIAAGASETVAVDVVAHADGPVATEVRVHAGEGEGARLLTKREVVADPARPWRGTLEVPASEVPLVVSLAPDALALDGEAVLLPEPPRVVPWAVEAGEATAAALRLDRLPAAAAGVARVAPEAAALVFADAEGDARAGTTRVVVRAAGTERDDWLGPFLLDRAHALVEGLALEGVVWSSGREALAGRGLVHAGTKTLLSEEALGGATVVRLDLDPARSTLVGSPDWPILLSNLVERARASLPGAESVNLRTGQSARWRTSADAAAEGWRLVAPRGSEERARGRGLLVFDPKEPGVHRLLAPSGEVARFSVAYVDGRESDLRARGEARRPARPRPAGASRADAVPAAAASNAAVRALALALLAVLALDALATSRGRRRAAA